MSSDKEKLIAGFFSAEKSTPKSSKPLIQDLSEMNLDDAKVNTDLNETFDASKTESNNDDGPSLFEQMMMAQKAAKSEVETKKNEKQKEEAKKGFKGFKKGFFNEPKKSSSNSKIQSTSKTSGNAPQANIKASSADLTTIRKKEDAKNSLVLDEVQKKMEEDQNKLLSSLKTDGK